MISIYFINTFPYFRFCYNRICFAHEIFTLIDKIQEVAALQRNIEKNTLRVINLSDTFW